MSPPEEEDEAPPERVEVDEAEFSEVVSAPAEKEAGQTRRVGEEKVSDEKKAAEVLIASEVGRTDQRTSPPQVSDESWTNVPLPSAPNEGGRELEWDSNDYDPIDLPWQAEDMSPPEEEDEAPPERIAVDKEDPSKVVSAPAEKEARQTRIAGEEKAAAVKIVSQKEFDVEAARKATEKAEDLRVAKDRVRRAAEKAAVTSEQRAVEKQARKVGAEAASNAAKEKEKLVADEQARRIDQLNSEKQIAEYNVGAKSERKVPAEVPAQAEEQRVAEEQDAGDDDEEEEIAEKQSEAKAKLLHDAIEGFGTDEDTLIKVICQTSVAERQRIKDAFFWMYDEDLVDKVEGDTSGDFQKALLCMLNATEKSFDLEADCRAMYDAMNGWGTDETVLVQMICNKTRSQMQLVNQRFKELYNRELYEFVESETSGHFQAVMLGWIGRSDR